VVASLSAFMNTELSAFYFDIRKDTLVLRSAVVAGAQGGADHDRHHRAYAILKCWRRVLSFTCEEAWRCTGRTPKPSVHLTLFPDGSNNSATMLSQRVGTIRDVRRVVNGALELERAARTSAPRSRPRR